MKYKNGKKVFKSDLSVEGIKNLQQQLRGYQQQLNNKNLIFVQRLSELGISVGRQNVGGFGKYIMFSTKVSQNVDNCKTVLIAKDSGKIINQWKTQDGIKSADVSPLLMAEFGSGQYAENPLGVSGVGQGTFPEQTHAFDKEGWYWQDLNNEWHHSYGVSPTMPMYKAVLEMRASIRRIAKEVFGS